MSKEMTPDERAAYDVMLRFPAAAVDSLEPKEERRVIELIADAIHEARREVALLLDELAEDTDAGPCRYDHHGCQEHGWLDDGGCRDKAAHELLKRLGGR